VVFILATTEYHKIPATILSRCQQYSFKLIQYPLILERLREISKAEGIQISTGALEQVVFSSGGSMRDAMSALDQVIAFSGNSVRDEDVAALLGLVEPKVLGQTIRAIASDDIASLLKIVADLMEVGQDLTNFCRRLSGQFRNLMVLKAGIADTALLGIPESLLPELREQADLFSREDLLRLFEAFQKIESGMRYATQVRFQLEMGLIELGHIAKLRPIEELIAEFSTATESDPPRKPSTASNLPPAQSSPFSGGHTAGSRISPMSAAPRAKSSPVESVTPRAAASPTPEPALSAALAADPRNLLFKIAAAVGRESLESLMQDWEGAELNGNVVVLRPGKASEFARRQIKDNLAVIAQATSRVFGGNIKVVLAESEASTNVQDPATPDNRPDVNDPLEAAKQVPIVKSFLDVFPGPVKAEKLDK
jgi:DNA polymerase-3 subunit gamma/tau